jgi:hypothetical protein
MSILLGRRGVKAIGDLAHECLNHQGGAKSQAQSSALTKVRRLVLIAVHLSGIYLV